MATILLSDCTVTQYSLPGMNKWKIVTPSTADVADTIDVSDTILAGSIYSVRIAASTDGLVAGTATTAGAIWLNGSTNNEARTVYVYGRSA